MATELPEPVTRSEEYLYEIATNGGGGGGGTMNYEQLNNKPQINSIELVGDLSAEDLGIDAPIATRETAGKIKIGEGLIITEDGTASVIPETYKSLKRVKEYLYETEYEKLDYEFAYDYFRRQSNDAIIGGCSVARSGAIIGRNFDWVYDEGAEFVVKTPENENGISTLGVASGMKDLTDAFVQSGEYSELYRILPFAIVDGINNKRLYASTNVVPVGDIPTTGTLPYQDLQVEICASMLVRYVLDHFSNAFDAVEYIRNHMSVYMPRPLIEMGYEAHYLIADTNSGYIVEFTNNEVVVVDNYPFLQTLTNFRVGNVIFEPGACVYTPFTSDGSHDPIHTNRIEQYGQGLERYNYIIERLNDGFSEADMQGLMENLCYTKTYDSFMGDNDWWATEFAGADGLTVASKITDYRGSATVQSAFAKFARRNRNPESENYGTWQTVHTAIYNLAEYRLTIFVQEDYLDSHQYAIEIQQEFGTAAYKDYADAVRGGEALPTEIAVVNYVRREREFNVEMDWNGTDDSPSFPPDSYRGKMVLTPSANVAVGSYQAWVTSFTMEEHVEFDPEGPWDLGGATFEFRDDHVSIEAFPEFTELPFESDGVSYNSISLVDAHGTPELRYGDTRVAEYNNEIYAFEFDNVNNKTISIWGPGHDEEAAMALIGGLRKCGSFYHRGEVAHWEPLKALNS